MSQPQIVIDSDDKLRIVCRLLFYNIPGFHPNAKKLHKACQEEGYSFRLQDIVKWVKHQYSYQIYQQCYQVITCDLDDGSSTAPHQITIVTNVPFNVFILY